MRARWAILIAGGVLVLAVGLLLVFSKQGRMNVRVIGNTKDDTFFYVVQLTNSTGKPHGFYAFSEYTADDRTWERYHSYDHTSAMLPPDGSAQFTCSGLMMDRDA